MAKERNLKLNLMADTSKFNAGMKSAEASVSGFDGTISKVSAKASAAFAALAASAGYAAVRMGKDAVQAAMEDQRSARILELQLRKTVQANDAVIKSVDNYISATSLRVGVQDDTLRPSLARLLRSTEDVTEAQDLLNLALDISVASGKDVDSVASALGKAYDGNAVSLGKLGLGIDSAILKSGDMNAIVSALRQNFGGFADNEAQTLDGKIRRLKISTDELKESIGYMLMPSLEGFVTYAQETLIPTLNDIKDGYEGNTTATDNLATTTGSVLADLKVSWSDFFSTFTSSGGGGIFKIFIIDALAKIKQLSNALEGVARAVQWVKDKLGIVSGPKVDLMAVPSYLKRGAYNFTLDSYTDNVDNAAKKTKKLTAAQEAALAVQKALEEQAKKVADAFERYSESISSSISSAINFSTAFSERGNGSFLDALRRQAKLAYDFGGKISKLVQMGLSRGALSQLIAAGPVAGSQIADELISGGAGAVGETNALVGGIAEFSNLVGQYGATGTSGTGAASLAGNNYNITINGALDPQGVARQLEELFQDAARRSGAISLVGATL